MTLVKPTIHAPSLGRTSREVLFEKRRRGQKALIELLYPSNLVNEPEIKFTRARKKKGKNYISKRVRDYDEESNERGRSGEGSMKRTSWRERVRQPAL